MRGKQLTQLSKKKPMVLIDVSAQASLSRVHLGTLKAGEVFGRIHVVHSCIVCTHASDCLEGSAACCYWASNGGE